MKFVMANMMMEMGMRMEMMCMCVSVPDSVDSLVCRK